MGFKASGLISGFGKPNQSRGLDTRRGCPRGTAASAAPAPACRPAAPRPAVCPRARVKGLGSGF